MYKNINLLARALDASWKRNEIITNNIANAETPGFKKSVVLFEEILREQLSGGKLKGVVTNPRHIRINDININDIKYKIKTEDNFSTRMDKNNVDIDVEMAERAKNEIVYNVLTDKIQSNFRRIKFIINEGR
ncbi:MAG: flagellar basal body rod protein FlgB [Clostridiales bacterium]|nr:flagellar basal body rod protein FlgB [Clostridiales bacterium]